MEELNVNNDLELSAEESETDTREQNFKENYKAALAEGCEKSSSSSNESLRRECPELYNAYRAKVMKHLECLEGGTTQVQIDAFRDNCSSLTIRELDGEDEEPLLGLGHRERMGVNWCDGANTLCLVRNERSVIAQDEELNERVSSNSTDGSSGHVSSNSTDELNRRVSSNITEESNENSSSNSTDESNGPTSSNSTSSVDEETPEYPTNLTLPMYVEINERTSNNNNASVFGDMSPDVALSNNEETEEQMPDNTPLMREGTDGYVQSNIPPNCEEIVTWQLPDYAHSGNEEMDGRFSSSLNAEANYVGLLTGNEEMDGRLSSSLNAEADYVLTANEEMGHSSSSLNNAEIHNPIPDCVPTADEEIAGYSCSSLRNAEKYESMPYYARPGNEEMIECFSSPMPDVALTGDEEMVGHLSSSLNNAEIHKHMPDRTLTADTVTVGYLSGSLNNADVLRPMPDYALTGNKEIIGCFSSSLNNADICMPRPDSSLTGNQDMSRSVDADGHRETIRDYTSINDRTGGFVPGRNLSLGINELDYTSMNDQSCGRVLKRNPSWPNQNVYGSATLDYVLTDDKVSGQLPYRSASTINERLGARRRDELRRASLLKKEEFGHPVERGVFIDYSKDGRRPPPPASRSLEDLRSSPPPPVRPPPPKVSFFSFEQELSRCENALREARAELREERKKQVVVDTFRMNLLEVDRMCSEEMSRLREEAARLEPLNKMAAEWERDSRQTCWYNQYQYSREHQRSFGRDCFMKSYVRRLADPETCPTTEVRPPTI